MKPSNSVSACARSLALLTLGAACGGSADLNGPGPTGATTAPAAPLPAQQMRALLERHFETAQRPGVEGQRAYAESLAGLRLRAEEVAGQLALRLRGLPPQRHAERYTLVHELAALHTPGALPALLEVARTPVTAGSSMVTPGDGGFDRGHLVRIRAVEGIGKLASSGNGEALGALTELVRSEDRALRLAAARAFLHSGPPAERSGQLRAALAPEDQWIAGIRTIPAEELPRAIDTSLKPPQIVRHRRAPGPGPTLGPAR
jgi:hypothetical protein